MLKIPPRREIKGYETNKVTPLLICSESLKKEAAVPLCSGILTSIITALLFATGPAPNIEAIKAKIKNMIYVGYATNISPIVLTIYMKSSSVGIGIGYVIFKSFGSIGRKDISKVSAKGIERIRHIVANLTLFFLFFRNNTSPKRANTLFPKMYPIPIIPAKIVAV